MKTISIINLKGGVGKTISAINIADVLVRRGKRVLLVDNDKQANASKFFRVMSYDRPSISEVLTHKNFPLPIQQTGYSVDVLPANMTLLRANKDILLDTGWMQQNRLRKALATVADKYDYAIIDNAPDINMCTINALVASDDVLIPVKVDKFALDGLDELTDQIEDVRDWNPNIRIAGGFLTMYQFTKVNTEASALAQEGKLKIPFFHTVIRKCTAVDQSTFLGHPLNAYRKPCAAAMDYVTLVNEYLAGANN